MKLRLGSSIALTLATTSCGFFGMEPQAKPETTTPAASSSAPVEKPPAIEKPDLAKLIGTDVDTANLEAFREIKKGMSHDEVGKILPGVAGKKDNFVSLPSSEPGVERIRLSFLEGKIVAIEVTFYAAIFNDELWQELITTCEAKYGPAKDRAAARIYWPGVSVSLDKGDRDLEVFLDEHRGRAAAFDIAAFVGSDKGSVPAFFGPYPKTLTREAAMKSVKGAVKESEAFVSIIPEEGATFRELDFYFPDKGNKLDNVEVKLHKSVSNRQTLLALRDALGKRFGKPPHVYPKNSDDTAATGFSWRKPDLSLSLYSHGELTVKLSY